MQYWVFDVRSRPFFLLIALFAILTIITHQGIISPIDVAISESVYGIGGKNFALDLFMEVTTETGDVYYMLGFGILLLILRRTRRIGLSIMISLVIVTIITGYAKCGIDRDRPELEYQGGALEFSPSADTFSLFCDKGFDASYPSGHAARAAVFGIILGAALFKMLGSSSYLLLLYPVLVSASRIYILEHYPSDVIGGAILGILVAGIVYKKTQSAAGHDTSESQRLK